MINSRDINELREDVRVNCLKWVELCREAGLNVLVTGTYRDAEYQQYAFMNGTSATPKLGPHHFRLAFDFCKNVKGHEYDDLEFFRKAAGIGKEMGFLWGGDWKEFVDRPHLEWLGDPQVSREQLRNGVVPSPMPKYGEEEVPEWGRDAWAWCEGKGLIDGKRPMSTITRLELAVVLYRMHHKML